MNSPSKRVLIIYTNGDPPEVTRKTITDHLNVMEYCDINHDVVYYNTYETVPHLTQIDTKSGHIPDELCNRYFDAIILHYTFLSFRTLGLPFYKWKRKFDWIRDLKALKIAIPQDEADYAALLDEWLYDLGVSVIFSVHYKSEGPLYPTMRNYAEIYPCLPGYIEEKTAQEFRSNLLSVAVREKDIVYRARRLPHWYGRAGLLKYRIADVVEPKAKALGFNVDISTRVEDSIMSRDWLKFLASSKAVIGTQGGYSAINWRGELKEEIRAILREESALSFEEVSAKMQPGWDDYQLFTITPRHFEAVITKTCQLLLEGEYKGVLEADKHYIALKKDFSNLDEALERLRDHSYVQQMVDQAYEDIYLSGHYTYRIFSKKIEEAIIRHNHMERRPMALQSGVDASEEAIAALERELIAERQQNALLFAVLPDLAEQMVDMVISALGKRLKARIRKFLPLVLVLILAGVVVILLSLS